MSFKTTTIPFRWKSCNIDNNIKIIDRLLDRYYDSLDESGHISNSTLRGLENDNLFSFHDVITREYTLFKSNVFENKFSSILNSFANLSDYTQNKIESERYKIFRKYLHLKQNKHLRRSMIIDFEKELSCIYGYQDISNIPKLLILDLLIYEFKHSEVYKEYVKRRQWYTNGNIVQHLEFSKRDRSLLQPISHDYVRNNLVFDNFGEKYNYLLSFRRATLPPWLRSYFDYVIEKLYGFYEENDWMDLLKDFGTLCLRRYIENKLPSWILYFVELHMLSGYDTTKHKGLNMIEECSAFITPREPDANFAERVHFHIRDLIDNIEIKRYPKLTLENWLSFPDNFAIFGSANRGEKMELHTTNMKNNYKDGTKFARWWSHNVEWWKAELMRIKPYYVDVFLKTDELAKTRYVMGYDYCSFIICSLFYYCLGNLNKREYWTTIDMTPNQIYSIQKKEISILGEDSCFWYLCTDQSAFDQHVYKDFFLYALRYLLSKICQVNPQLSQVADVELICTQMSKIRIDGEEYDWLNGLCSGHKFTGLLGSVINGAVSRTIANEAGLPVLRSMFQGDDAYMLVGARPDKEKISELYKKYDLVVNPMKTWVSNMRFEYLHQIYDENHCIRSLPTRGLVGLLWRNPKAVEVGALAHIQSLMDVISMTSRRGNITKKVGYGYIIRYLKRNNPTISSRMIYNWMHTPKACGGGNVLPYVDSSLWSALGSKITQSDNVKTSIVTNYINEYSCELDKWIIKRMYDHIPKPGVSHKLHIDLIGDAILQHHFKNKVHIPLSISFDPEIPNNYGNFRRRILFDLGKNPVIINGRDRTSAYLDYIKVKEYTFSFVNNIREIRSDALFKNIKNIWRKAILEFNYLFYYDMSSFRRMWNYYHKQIYNFIQSNPGVYDPSLSRVHLTSEIITYLV